MKISQILKYSGIVLGGLAALKLVFVALSLITQHPVAIVILGLGALAYFIGVWLSKQDK